ncbi:MAG TPA: hypothetical protein VME42_01020 [Steroidobacteraceae bacterium]|nr:hypothetical protein [Steroidobacteraceae bacterium]
MAKLIAAPRTLQQLPSLAEFRKDLRRGATPAARLVREERAAR